jgi:translation elongation factor P/translation initiation factor 5A
MKIIAKDLKVGQTVKFYNVWVKIEIISYSTTKKGRGVVDIIGTHLPGIIKRRGHRDCAVPEIKNYHCNFYSETTVSVK